MSFSSSRSWLAFFFRPNNIPHKRRVLEKDPFFCTGGLVSFKCQRELVPQSQQVVDLRGKLDCLMRKEIKACLFPATKDFYDPTGNEPSHRSVFFAFLFKIRSVTCARVCVYFLRFPPQFAATQQMLKHL